VLKVLAESQKNEISMIGCDAILHQHILRASAHGDEAVHAGTNHEG
jgi:hypothetical protein